MSPLSVLGIDPGIDGAFAILDSHQVTALDHLPICVAQRGRTARARNELDLHVLKDVLIQHSIGHVWIEEVNAMPKQGVTSVFRFGRSAGALYGLVVGLGLPVSFVRPQQWQKFHGIGPTPDAARMRALQLFPSLSRELARERDCQRADALLIGAFALALNSTSTEEGVI